MKEEMMQILENEPIAKNTYEMVLQGDISEIKMPGQFVNLALPGFFLRRPISVCDAAVDRLTLIYKVVGHGTEEMAKLLPGARLSVLTGLGRGFNTAKSGESPLLIGGGVGVPPLYFLCKALLKKGASVCVVLGFNTAEEVFYAERFRQLGARVILMTADGSAGEKGYVTDALDGLSYSYFYTCGPMPMYRALHKVIKGQGEYSFEERMGCGFGACMGCSCQTKNGSKRICREGPVLESEEILWND